MSWEMQTDRANTPHLTDGAGHSGGDCSKSKYSSYSISAEPESTHSTIPAETSTTTSTVGSLTCTALSVPPMPNEPQPNPPRPESPDPDADLPSMVPRSADDLAVNVGYSMMENELAVDNGEDDDEHAESIYAASRYPAVPARYRVERFDETVTINSSSRSLYVEDLDYVLENGRRYCGDYIYPNDELEQDRLRLMHQVFLQVFDFELTSVHLEEPSIILDVGTGTGEWAIGMAEEFPNCEVIGVDISAIQPTAVPHNVFFEVDNCEIDWLRPDNTIDLVHMRNMAGAFSDWDFVYREALACLKPGGYLEVLDFHDHTSPNNTFLSCFPPESEIHAFGRAIDEAAIRARRRRGTHHIDAERLRSIGYVDVEITERVISFSPLTNSMAKLWLIACLHTVEASSLRLLTKYLEWDPEETLGLCDRICQEIKTKALDSTQAADLKVSLRVLTARKPTAEERDERSDDESTTTA